MVFFPLLGGGNTWVIFVLEWDFGMVMWRFGEMKEGLDIRGTDERRNNRKEKRRSWQENGKERKKGRPWL